MTMPTREQIIAEARSWLGTPWVHQHRTKGVGVDCAGLVIGVARALGVVPADFDVNGYGRQPDGTLLDVCDAHLHRVPRGQMQPGDVVVLAYERDPQHMGIVVPYRGSADMLGLVHAADLAGKVIEHRLIWHTGMTFRRAYSFPGVA